MKLYQIVACILVLLPTHVQCAGSSSSAPTNSGRAHKPFLRGGTNNRQLPSTSGSSQKEGKSKKGSSSDRNYRIQYIASADEGEISRTSRNCNLADMQEAYKYTILAEDYMVQTNLIVTTTADPETYYYDAIAPRQTDDMTVLVPQLGIISGDGVRDLFVQRIASRHFAYHMWDQPRVCKNDGADSYTVFFREYGLVQDANHEEDEHINVFTTIELTFDKELVQRLVSTRKNTLTTDGRFVDGARRS